MKSRLITLSTARPGLPGKGQKVQDPSDRRPAAATEPSTNGAALPCVDDFAFLSPRETEHYLFAVESSLQESRRQSCRALRMRVRVHVV